MKLKLSLPSKSFLVGEYLALEGGGSLLLATDPRFELVAEVSEEARCGGVHPESPAGVWMRQDPSTYLDLKMDFVDPHQGKGGFGASSAQFAFVYYVETIKRSHVFKVNSNMSYERLWKAFRATVFDDEGKTPSGADIVAQAAGGICHFSQVPFNVDNFKWSFENKGFALVHMGQKINTHDHLKELPVLPVSDLKVSFDEVLESLRLGDWAQFCSGVNTYAESLKRAGLVVERTSEFISAASKVDGVAAVKGCGALGADVSLICFDKSKMKNIIQFLKTSPVMLIADDTKLSAGIDVKLDLDSSLSVHDGVSL